MIRRRCLRKDMQDRAGETERPRSLAGRHRRQRKSEWESRISLAFVHGGKPCLSSAWSAERLSLCRMRVGSKCMRLPAGRVKFTDRYAEAVIVKERRECLPSISWCVKDGSGLGT